MGTNGHVACNCWKEGKTLPLPPEISAEYIEVEPDGTLDWGWPGGGTPIELLIEWDRWRFNACTHHCMDFYNDKLWWGRMQQELDRYPDKPLQVMRAVMQLVSDHGEASPDISKAALGELRHLRSLTANEEFQIVLSDFEAMFKASIVTGNPVVFS